MFLFELRLLNQHTNVYCPKNATKDKFTVEFIYFFISNTTYGLN